ncbi:acyltransferase [Microbacterium sp. ARD32]|uniref:acyltransferase family protein n=1 Tax=Microbacterium sp. ARD32 TaxID=2962577 RepID=UPI002881513C|nr:acyltransferase [Microbacterium sp. ARD32]MDT0157048.1 acyltransferase [Microbacterium sp. ARD32]
MTGHDRARPHNNFDVLRIIAASMVVIGHAWPLTGHVGVPRLGGISIHHLGVYVFFAISGFLLATSWARDPRAGAFLLRRALRILPALIVVVLVSMLAIGPLITTATADEYWRSSTTWTYLINIVLLAQYDLPGVFTGNPTSAVNGSLWSLGPEFSSYLMLVVVGMIGIRASRWLRGALGAGIAGLTLLLPLHGALRTTAAAVIFFIVGSLIAELPRAWRLPIWPAVLGLVALTPCSGTLGLAISWLVVPYAVIVIGTRSAPIAAWTRRIGDPSYGMYLWAFPAQQLLVMWWPDVPIALCIVILIPATAAIGALSWHLIEHRAIRLGSRLSARRRRRETLCGVP